MFDYHVHSDFSGDCETNIGKLLDYAILKGLDEIAITDHIDYEYNYKEINFEFDMDAHRNTFKALKEEYAGRIKIKRGIEIGMQPHVLKRNSDLIDRENFDFVIASVHECEMKDFFVGDFFEGRSPEESLLAYLDETHKMVSEYDRFNVLGHLDILKRYSKDINMLGTKNYLDYYAKILGVIIPRGQGIEINTSGLNQKGISQFPDFEIVKLYKELGGEILTIGSDSHVPENLCSNFGYIKKELQKIGFTKVHGFSDMKPYEIDLLAIEF